MSVLVFSLALSFLVYNTECSREGKLVLIENPGEAVCLDGSPPGYYFRKGFGSGVNSWVVHLQGGAWCYNKKDCLARSRSYLGSSRDWPQIMIFNNAGMFSDSKEKNPDFYNWNMAQVQYCDGASFAGYVEKPVKVHGTDIYFRGFKILQAIIQSLMSKGMKNAQEFILTGCSAGGLATYLHADYIRSLFPPSVKYRAISDAGYFIDAPNKHGFKYMRYLFKNVFYLQNCSGGVDQDCIAAYESTHETWKCFMAQYTYRYISSPIFTLNSMNDIWQLKNILGIKCLPPKCTESDMKHFYNFVENFNKASEPIFSLAKDGAFLDSCLIHCQALISIPWRNFFVKGQSASTTFSNWYFNRDGSKSVKDCKYPCNKSCKSIV
ncbi:PREDICTED: pectin acetylesterase 5-like [Amphimedon queenslandica]|uniref:Pectin acetylesterase n=1 Tax=Amphimedon queenslandica TaxID=400682 RepID=A0A1X7UEM4_AMPQE|nr:PREDICTED: pectin acetylesterase 5-like [Amphimedon queenslandica]|eukprot:XP_019854868.1 PREDICTED: pectin acetylesterase 5-like [Amphimedon queenslandica]